jgi:hypothetical protein
LFRAYGIHKIASSHPPLGGYGLTCPEGKLDPRTIEGTTRGRSNEWVAMDCWPSVISGRLRVRTSTAGALSLLSGCSSAPSRNILGSYFPSWMICALIGMGATVAVRALLAKTGIDAVLPMPIVVYLAIATAFSLAIWLLWLA